VNLFSLLDYGAQRHPDEGAIFLGEAQVCSWRELRDRAARLGAGLDLPRGARVAIAAANCPQYVEILFGAWAAGLVAVPMNFKLAPREVADILAMADASVLLASGEVAAELRGAGVQGLPRLIEIGGADYEALQRAAPAGLAEVAPDDLAWLFFTSGTTGRSKGAMLSHRNLLAMTIAHLADFEDLGHTDAIVHGAPMSHGSGLYVLPYVARAARQVIPASGGFDAAEFLDLCAHHGRVGAFMAPTMVNRTRAEIERRGRPAEGLRSIIYGGAPMYLEDLKAAIEVFGPILTQLYGQGESPMTITGLRRKDHASGDPAVLGSVGWPRSGMEVAVLRADGSRAGPGEIGEIVCRGDIVMSGYWKDEAATAAALQDGWLRTGDVGEIDADGKLTLRDRSKDLIISGGSNIYPREVEEVLLTHPAVAEAAVIGQPDREWGEVVVAVIAPPPGAPAPTIEELDALCLANIARFKRPKRYVFVESLPKSSYGKILKRELIQQMREGRL
jgi:acyl-CoA synthetase (AMP-forming)/AMP-acid ligase II